MMIAIAAWGLVTHFLTTRFILDTLILSNKTVVAELTIIPLWNITAGVATNQTDSSSCHLTIDSNPQGVVKFTGKTAETCIVQLTTSNGTAALMQIPPGVLFYAERQENVLECPMKYISFTSDEPCVFVSWYPKLQLFLQRDNDNGSSIFIASIPGNKSVPACPKDANDMKQHASRVSQTNLCHTYEYNHLYSCNLSPDYTCSYKFPANCNVTLGNRDVDFQCLDEHIHSNHKALIIYPIGVINLNLTQISIIVIHENSFANLNFLKKLILDDNKLSYLSPLVLQHLTSLQYLSLERNHFETFDTGLFKHLITLNELSLIGNNLRSLPNGLFSGLRNLKRLMLNKTQLNSLDENVFTEAKRLTYLSLRDNNLTQVPSKLFRELKDLEYLDLSENHHLNSLDETIFHENKKLIYLSLWWINLKQLPNSLFKGLSKLQILDLDDNKIVHVPDTMFHDLINLRVLYLRDSRFKALSSNLFRYTRNISVLDVAENQLMDIPDISHLRHLIFLNVKDNHMTGITKETFSNLPKGALLEVSQHEICECFVPDDTYCTAIEDRSPFLTCDRLLSDRILMVVMWLIGLNAIGGNIFVLCQRKSTSDKGVVQSLLLRNLATSDLLMGVYMLLIASADIYFGEHFPMFAEAWRSGTTCRIAGTISILSSEASVFFVTLISIDRYICIKYPYSSHKLSKTLSVIIVILLWITALALGVVPSVLAGKSDTFYDNSHVCIGLPLSKLRIYQTYRSKEFLKTCAEDNICYFKQEVESNFVGEINGMIFASVMFIGLNFICYLCILVCYVEIVRAVFKSSQRAGLNREMKEQIRLTSKVAAIVLTDFLCWFPIIILGILVQAGALHLSASAFAWCVTFVLPVNSAINPYLYTISGIISNRCKKEPVENQQGNMYNNYQSPAGDQNLIHTQDREMKVTTREDQHSRPSIETTG